MVVITEYTNPFMRRNSMKNTSLMSFMINTYECNHKKCAVKKRKKKEQKLVINLVCPSKVYISIKLRLRVSPHCL